MHNTNTIFRLKGTIQHYVWGGTIFLPALLKLPNDGKKPFAEYWLGAHSKSPAVVIMDPPPFVDVDELIGRDPELFLGARVYRKFGALPYLL